MKKILISLAFGLIGFFSMVQLNYEQAVSKAEKVASDGEIMEAMASHGFKMEDPFVRISPVDKISAFITCINQ